MEKIKFMRGSKLHPQHIGEMLRMNGGKDGEGMRYDDEGVLYYINYPNNWISTATERSSMYYLLLEYGEELYLEPDYKFAKGDKVRLLGMDQEFTITEKVSKKGQPCYVLNHNKAFTYNEFELELIDKSFDEKRYDQIKEELEKRNFNNVSENIAFISGVKWADENPIDDLL